MDSTMELTLKKKFHKSELGNEIHLDKAIKRSQVKQFITRNMSSKQGSVMEDISNTFGKSEFTNLSEHLLHLKTSYNQVKKDIDLKEHSVYKFKHQATYKQEKVKAIQTSRHTLQSKIVNLLQNLDQVKAKRDQVSHTSKTYEHILERMKKDIITHQIRKNELRKQEKTLAKGCKQTDKKFYATKEFEQLSIAGLHQAASEHHEQTHQRKFHITALSRVFEEKEENFMKKREREQQTQLIQEMAAEDSQDAELIRMKKFLTVQQFLRKLLKDKSVTLKERFEPYQNAFYQLKSSTTAKDAATMKANFFEFENSYAEKTTWVKHLQNQLEEAQLERKCLNSKLSELKEEELEMLENFESQGQREQVCGLKELSKKAFQYELLTMKIKSWLQDISSRFDIPSDNNRRMIQVFKGLCSQIRGSQPQNQERLSELPGQPQLPSNQANEEQQNNDKGIEEDK